MERGKPKLIKEPNTKVINFVDKVMYCSAVKNKVKFN